MKNTDISYFYKKAYSNVGITTIVFSVVFVAYSLLKNVGNFIVTKDFFLIIDPFINWLQGKPYYHMWYLYVLCIIYIMVPFVMKVKKSIKWKIYKKLSIMFFIMTTISGWCINKYIVEWNIGKIICYLGFFLIGDVIRTDCQLTHVHRRKAFAAILFGFFCEVIAGFIKYWCTMRSIFDNQLELTIRNSFFPVVVIGALVIFFGFTAYGFVRGNKLSHTNKAITKISPLTLYIYLVHVVVLDICTYAFSLNSFENTVILIPIISVVVFVVSLVISWGYNILWKYVDEKFLVTERSYLEISKCIKRFFKY